MAYLLAGATLVLALVVRPAVARRGSRWLDAALVAYVAVVAAAIVPLPPAIRLALSPATRTIDLTFQLDGTPAAASEGVRALSIDPAATTVTLALSIALLLLFWCARAVFAHGGVRLCVRAIAGLGLVLAAFGIAAACDGSPPPLLDVSDEIRLAVRAVHEPQRFRNLAGDGAAADRRLPDRAPLFTDVTLRAGDGRGL